MDFGEEATQDLKNCNARKKMREHTITKPQRNLFLKQIITVRTTLWWTICPFTKCDLLLIVIFGYNTMGKIHGWMNTMGGCDNTMAKYHGWMNTIGGFHLQYHGWMSLIIPWVNSMGGWISWIDVIFSSDHSSLLKKQCFPLREVPSCEAFVEYEEPLKRRVLCG